MNRQHVIAALLACTLTSASYAATTICKVKSDTVSPLAVSWDTDTGLAKIQLRYGDPVEGRLTMSRPHDDGVKVNLFFPKTDKPLSEDMEFIVFPVFKTTHRILGVSYRTIDGRRFLNASLGNFEALCNTL